VERARRSFASLHRFTGMEIMVLCRSSSPSPERRACRYM
jgi:hypothetical protein